MNRLYLLPFFAMNFFLSRSHRAMYGCLYGPARHPYIARARTGYRLTLLLFGSLLVGALTSHRALAVTKTWTGASSTNWGTAANWNPSGVPGDADEVVINDVTNDPVIASGTTATAGVIYVNSGARLTINSGGILLIRGAGGIGLATYTATVINNGVLRVETTSGGAVNAVSPITFGSVFTNNGLLSFNTNQRSVELADQDQGGGACTITNGTSGTINFSSNVTTGIITNRLGQRNLINNGTINFNGTNDVLSFITGTVSLTNTGTINVNSGTGINNSVASTITNQACGKINLFSGDFNNTNATTTNFGAIHIAGTLTRSGGSFTNNGVLNYGSLSGTITNNNGSVIVNENPTNSSIFTYQGTFTGTINGIYTNSAATTSAGSFTAPNTFVPSTSLPTGPQTLYAKITPSGGACNYVVPFGYSYTPPPTVTTHPVSRTVCTGNSTFFSVAATNASSYQWQVNTGGGFTNLNNATPYSGVTSQTLTISNTAGFNGYQYRCVVTGGGGNTNSNGATLTVASLPTVAILTPTSTTLTCTTPTLTLTATGGSTYRWEDNTATATRTVSTSGTYSVTVTNASNCTAATSQVVRSATATITTTNPVTNTAIVGAGFSQTFTSTSTGAASRTFAIASGILPTGLSLASTGVLSGTPTQSGTFTVTVRATDVNGCSATGSSYILTVNNLTPTIVGFAPASASLCAGSTATFTATVGNVTTPYNFTLSNGTSTTTGTKTSTAFSQSWVAAGSGAQAFTLTVSQSGQTTRATASLSVVALPTAGISLPANLTVTCASPSVALTATGGSTYRWENNSVSAIRSITTTGTYAVTVTNASGCSATSSSLVTVTQNTTPPTLVLSATNVCEGGAVRLSATTGLTSYTFSRSDGSLISSGSASTATVSGLAVGSYTLTVRGTNSVGCSNTALTSVTVLAPPSLTLTARNTGGAISNTLTCASPSLTLTASGATSYTFAGTGIVSSGAAATVSQTGTFTLTGRNASGCVSTTTITIQSTTATVSVSIPTTNTALAGVAFSQTFGATGGQPAYTFSVAGGLLPSGLSLSPAGSLTGTPTQTGTFNVTVRGTDANGCSGVSSVYSLTIQSTDVGSLSVTPNAVCAGNRVTFTASVSGISGTYNYTLTNGSSQTTGSTASTAFSQSWTAAGSGLQAFTLIVSDNSFTDQSTATLTVNPLPDAGINVPVNTTITCASPVLTLTATGGNTYRWENNTTNAQRAINTTGTYTVTVTNGSGCTAVASQLVTVSENTSLPVISLSAVNVCEGESVSLVATSDLSTGAPAGYTFISSEGILGSGTDPGTEVTELTAGVYSFTVRVANSAGCINTATTSVTVHALPTPTLTASHSGLLSCAQPSLTLTASGGTLYAFAGTGLISQNPAAGTAVLNQTGLYSVTVTNTATGCSSTTDISIGQDNTLPVVDINPAGGILTCASPALTLTATGGTSYTWTASPALPGGTSTGSTLPVSAPGTYTVTATGANGCTVSASVSVGQDVASPVASLAANGTLTCAQTTAGLTADAGGLLSVSYVFAGPAGGGPSGIVTQDGTTGLAEVNRAGVYSVTVINTITGCSTVTTTTVSQNTTTPSVSIDPASATITCTNAVVSLTASGATLAGDSYLWSNGLSDDVITVSSPGTYTVVLTAATGCTASASAVVSQRTDLPVAGLVVSGTVTCAVPAVTLTASGGDSYAFFGPEIISQDPVAGTALVGAGGSYGVVVSNTTTGCSSNTLIDVSQNNTRPEVSLTASNTALTCSQTSVTLTAGAVGGGLTYAFAGPDGPLTGSGATLIVNNPGLYSVTATGDGNCTSTASLFVGEDKETPNVILTPDSGTLTCASPTLTLTATEGFSNYRFSNGQNGIGNTLTVSSADTYSVIVTAANGCTNVASATVESTSAVISASLVASWAISCNTPSVTLTAGPAGISYSFGSGATQLGNSNLATVDAAGTYSVTVSDAGGCSAVAQVTVTGSTTAPTGATLTAGSGGTLTCGQTALTLTAGATGLGLSYSFSGPGVVAQSGNSATVNVAGNYSVVITGSNGCTTSATTTVYSNTAAPVVSLTPSSATLTCASPTVTLTATSGLTSYSFSTGQNGSGNTLLVSSAGTYSVIVTGSNGCTSLTSATVVSSTAVISASLVASGAISCNSPSVTLTASPSNLTYSFGGGATRIGLTNQATVNAAGTYSVTVSDAGGCSAVAQVTVTGSTTAPTGATLTASHGGTLTCAGTALTLTAGATGSGFSYSFSGSGVLAQSGSSATVNAAGNYSVVITGNNSCTTSAATTVHSNTAAPTVSLTPSSATLTCATPTVTLTATSGLTSYSFSTGQNGTGNTLLVTSAGTYSVLATGANGCTSLTSATVVSSTAVISASLVASGAISCNSPSVTLTASPSNLTYSFGGGATRIGLTNQATVNAAGTYSVTVSDAGGCSAVAQVTVTGSTTAPTGATLTASHGGTLTCAGTALTLTAGATGSGFSYSFVGAGIVAQSGSSATVNTAGNYSVVITGSNSCTTSATTTVYSNTAPPSLSISPSSVTLTCASPSAILSVVGTGDARWSTGAVSNTISVASAGTYSVTLTGGNGCTSVSSATIVSATAAPALSINPSSTVISCASPTVSLSAVGTGQVRWSTGAVSAVISVSVADTYSVTLTDGGSCTATTSIVVSASSLGTATVTAGGSLGCGVTTTTVRVQATGATSFTLSGPNGYNQTNSSGIFSVSAGGSYTGLAGLASCVVSNTAVVAEGGVQPTISSVQAAVALGSGACRVSVQGAGYGDRYVLTGPSYVFSVVFRTAGEHSAVFPDVVKPGTYTLTVYSGNCVVTRTVAVSGTACQ